MTKNKASKKTLMTVLVTGSLIAAGAGIGMAYPPAGDGPPMNKSKQYQKLDPEALQARENFLNATVTLRKELTQKHAAMRAMMRSENPDPKKASALSGEIFDLRETLRAKAKENGVKAGPYSGLFDMGHHGCQASDRPGRFHKR